MGCTYIYNIYLLIYEQVLNIFIYLGYIILFSKGKGIFICSIGNAIESSSLFLLLPFSPLLFPMKIRPNQLFTICFLSSIKYLFIFSHHKTILSWRSNTAIRVFSSKVLKEPDSSTKPSMSLHVTIPTAASPP